MPVPGVTVLPVPWVVSSPGVSSTVPVSPPVRNCTVNWSDAAKRPFGIVLVTVMVGLATFLISHVTRSIASEGIVTDQVPFDPVVVTAVPSAVLQVADFV